MLPHQTAPQLNQLFPTSDALEIHMLQQTLTWDPGRRGKPSVLLDNAYFTQWRRREDEAVCHKVPISLLSFSLPHIGIEYERLLGVLVSISRPAVPVGPMWRK